MKIALYGGSFNPIHNGHLLTAAHIIEHYDYDYVYFIPAYSPVHKDNAQLIDGSHRIAMIELAIQDKPQFKTSHIELERKGSSYTIDTVDFFYENYEIHGKIGLIIGDDLLEGLHKWHEITKLLATTTILCASREQELNLPYKEIILMRNRIIEVSSSEIRKKVQMGQSISFLLPKVVENYIYQNSLYQRGNNETC